MTGTKNQVPAQASLLINERLFVEKNKRGHGRSQSVSPIDPNGSVTINHVLVLVCSVSCVSFHSIAIDGHQIVTLASALHTHKQWTKLWSFAAVQTGQCNLLSICTWLSCESLGLYLFVCVQIKCSLCVDCCWLLLVQFSILIGEQSTNAPIDGIQCFCWHGALLLLLLLDPSGLTRTRAVDCYLWPTWQLQ